MISFHESLPLQHQVAHESSVVNGEILVSSKSVDQVDSWLLANWNNTPRFPWNCRRFPFQMLPLGRFLVVFSVAVVWPVDLDHKKSSFISPKPNTNMCPRQKLDHTVDRRNPKQPPGMFLKPCKWWDELPTSTGKRRISEPSTVPYPQGTSKPRER